MNPNESRGGLELATRGLRDLVVPREELAGFPISRVNEADQVEAWFERQGSGGLRREFSVWRFWGVGRLPISISWGVRVALGSGPAGPLHAVQTGFSPDEYARQRGREPAGLDLARVRCSNEFQLKQGIDRYFAFRTGHWAEMIDQAWRDLAYVIRENQDDVLFERLCQAGELMGRAAILDPLTLSGLRSQRPESAYTAERLAEPDGDPGAMWCGIAAICILEGAIAEYGPPGESQAFLLGRLWFHNRDAVEALRRALENPEMGGSD